MDNHLVAIELFLLWLSFFVLLLNEVAKASMAAKTADNNIVFFIVIKLIISPCSFLNALSL